MTIPAILGRAGNASLIIAARRAREHAEIAEKLAIQASQNPENKWLRLGLGSAQRRARESEAALTQILNASRDGK